VASRAANFARSASRSSGRRTRVGALITVVLLVVTTSGGASSASPNRAPWRRTLFGEVDGVLVAQYERAEAPAGFCQVTFFGTDARRPRPGARKLEHESACVTNSGPKSVLPQLQVAAGTARQQPIGFLSGRASRAKRVVGLFADGSRTEARLKAGSFVLVFPAGRPTKLVAYGSAGRVVGSCSISWKIAILPAALCS
jgi:hypothetical protein